VANGKDIPFEQLGKLTGARLQIAGLKVDFLNSGLMARVNNLASDILKRPNVRHLLISQYQKNLENLASVYDQCANCSLPPFTFSLNKCISAYSMQMAKAPTQAQLAIAAQTEANSRDGVKNFIMAKFPESPDKISKLLGNWKFLYPETRDGIHQKFAADIKDYKEYGIGLQATMNPNDFLEPGTWMDFCFSESNMTHVIRDATYTVEGRIYVGWESVMYPEMGLQIMSHEMGHMLSTSFQNGLLSKANTDKYIQIRQCISQKHIAEAATRKLVVESRKLTESLYTEEDWADLVGSESTMQVQTNMWCTAYQRPNVWDSDLVHTTASNADPHSPILFRLLNVEMMHKGSLPNACNALVQKASTKIDFRSCL
jgi:hypothetical protein